MSADRAAKNLIRVPPPPLPQNIPCRDGVLQTLEYTRSELQRKLKGGRFRDPEAEKLRDAKTRLLIYNCQVLAGVLKDADLDEIKRRIEDLEERNKNRTPGRTRDPMVWSEK